MTTSNNNNNDNSTETKPAAVAATTPASATTDDSETSTTSPASTSSTVKQKQKVAVVNTTTKAKTVTKASTSTKKKTTKRVVAAKKTVNHKKRKLTPGSHNKNSKKKKKTTTKKKKPAPKQQQKQKFVVETKWRQLPGTVNVCDPYWTKPSSSSTTAAPVGRSSPLPDAAVEQDKQEGTTEERRAAKRRRVEEDDDSTTNITTAEARTAMSGSEILRDSTKNSNTIVDTNGNKEENDSDGHPKHLPLVLRVLKKPTNKKKVITSKTYFPLGTRREIKRTIVKAYDLHKSAEILQEFLHHFLTTMMDHNNNHNKEVSSLEFAKRTIEAVIQTQRQQRDAILNVEPEKLSFTERLLQDLVRHKMKYGDLDIRRGVHGLELHKQVAKLRRFHLEVQNNKNMNNTNNQNDNTSLTMEENNNEEEKVEEDEKETTTQSTIKTPKYPDKNSLRARHLQVFVEEDAPILTEFGFLWYDPRRPPWEEMFEMLKEYKDRHGDCNVPQQYKVPGREVGNGLGLWVCGQRCEYEYLQCGQKSQMTQERIEKLESIGFVWKLRFGRPKKGDERFRNKRLGIFGTRNNRQQEQQQEQQEEEQQATPPSQRAVPERFHIQENFPTAASGALGITPQQRQQLLFDDDYNNENYRWHMHSNRIPFR